MLFIKHNSQHKNKDMICDYYHSFKKLSRKILRLFT